MIEIKEAKYTPEGLLLKAPTKDIMIFLNDFKAGKYEIIPYKPKRSLDANSYCWVLCDLIANKLRVSKEEIYRHAIRSVGIYREFHDIHPEDARTIKTAWNRLGVGWVCEQVDYEADGDLVVLRAYYGSSTYNKKQMCRLIDWLIQDAKAVGVETMPPNKLNSLLEQWDGK